MSGSAQGEVRVSQMRAGERAKIGPARRQDGVDLIGAGDIVKGLKVYLIILQFNRRNREFQDLCRLSLLPGAAI